MSNLHIANVYFESELIANDLKVVEDELQKSLIYLQLQFLPFLYAEPEDTIMITHPPEEEFFERLDHLGIPIPHWQFFKTPLKGEFKRVHYWGASNRIRSIVNDICPQQLLPPWDLTKTINSKAFSSLFSDGSLSSRLIHNKEELCHFLASESYPLVLKTLMGVSGRGHFILRSKDDPYHQDVEKWAYNEWVSNRPVLGELWVERVLDFSTQWVIEGQNQIEYKGVTICENNHRGQYCSSIVGDLSYDLDPYKEKFASHITKTKEILNDISLKGYIGDIGVDSMIFYDRKGDIRLQLIVEINARKTMGRVALSFMQKHCQSCRKIKLSYKNSNDEGVNLLPTQLKSYGRSITFKKNLKFHPLF
ncbi:MAG: hypothetical protein ACOVOR_04130 [Rhabdochlamydiaceae bacterium]